MLKADARENRSETGRSAKGTLHVSSQRKRLNGFIAPNIEFHELSCKFADDHSSNYM
jgi:hypothetical protein